MKKVVYILVGLTAFFAGVGFFCLKGFIPSSETTQNIHFNEAKQTRIKAVLAVGGYYDVIDSTLKVIDYKNGYPAEENIEITEEIKNNRNFIRLHKELIDKRNDSQNRGIDGWAIVDVEFIGEFITDDNKSINAQNSKLKPVEVKQISDISFVYPKEFPYLGKYFY